MNAPLPSPAAPAAKNKNGANARRWTRRLPWLGGALLVGLVVVGLLPKPLPAEIAVVARGDLAVTVNEEGMTRVKNRYVIASPVAGQLRRIDWRPGAVVEAGKTVLAVLESGGADLLDARSLAQAEARVRAAEAAVAQAAAQRARAGANAKMQREDLVRPLRLPPRQREHREVLVRAQHHQPRPPHHPRGPLPVVVDLRRRSPLHA